MTDASLFPVIRRIGARRSGIRHRQQRGATDDVPAELLRMAQQATTPGDLHEVAAGLTDHQRALFWQGALCVAPVWDEAATTAAASVVEEALALNLVMNARSAPRERRTAFARTVCAMAAKSLARLTSRTQFGGEPEDLLRRALSAVSAAPAVLRVAADVAPLERLWAEYRRLFPMVEGTTFPSHDWAMECLLRTRGLPLRSRCGLAQDALQLGLQKTYLEHAHAPAAWDAAMRASRRVTGSDYRLGEAFLAAPRAWRSATVRAFLLRWLDDTPSFGFDGPDSATLSDFAAACSPQELARLAAFAAKRPVLPLARVLERELLREDRTFTPEELLPFVTHHDFAIRDVAVQALSRIATGDAADCGGDAQAEGRAAERPGYLKSARASAQRRNGQLP